MKLVHLFPDLMNLYGDYGNLAVLKSALEEAGQAVDIVRLAPGQTDLAVADLIYMGPGTEPALHAALTHLRPLAPALGEAMEKGIPMLFTGNAWLALGKSLTTGRGEVLEGLGLLDLTAAESSDRLTCDTVALPRGDGLPAAPVVGFQNRCDTVDSGEPPLFAVEMGAGNRPGDTAEGVCRGKLLCTHLTGPLLVKNPHLLGYVLSLLGVSDPPSDPGGHAARAYETTLAALRARQG